MIVKQPRRGESHFGDTKLFDLKVTDKNNNSFEMHVAGNQDLYWIPSDYKNVKTFYIDKSDEFLFSTFCELFKAIKQNDSDGLQYPKSMNGDKFSFISEDYHEDEANRLEIIKEKNQFVINFIKNENEGVFGGFRRGCIICFCNSGSRVPNVERQFMLMFNELAYYNDEIELSLE